MCIKTDCEYREDRALMILGTFGVHRINERGNVFRGRILGYAMTQVEDVAAPLTKVRL